MLANKQRGTPVDVKSLFFRYTLDAATDFLLGTSVNSLTSPKQRFADAFGEVQRVQSIIARAGPLNRFVPRKKFRECLKVMEEFIQPFIERTLLLSPEELEKRTKSDDGYTFLHALASYTRDRTVLRDQLTAVLLAGRDTTACTLSWLFYELSRRPDIVEKLRQEVYEHVGWERMPTYADLKSMRYLQHTINETLRLYPIVPFNVRMALKDTTLPHGGGPDGNSPIGVLKNTPIGYSTVALHRRPEIYPSQSEEFPDHQTFEPSRWAHWTPKPWTCMSLLKNVQQIWANVMQISHSMADREHVSGSSLPLLRSRTRPFAYFRHIRISSVEWIRNLGTKRKLYFNLSKM